MKECYKPKTSNGIQKASEEYLWKTHTEGVSIQDHYIAGAKWMLAQCEEWLRKSGRGQMIGSLNRYLEK